jgi:hypothetical protein
MAEDRASTSLRVVLIPARRTPLATRAATIR